MNYFRKSYVMVECFAYIGDGEFIGFISCLYTILEISPIISANLDNNVFLGAYRSPLSALPVSSLHLI